MMASFGHVAIGIATAKLFRSPNGTETLPARIATVAAFAVLALLPDADVLLVLLGAEDHGAIGHRGASHSLVVAAAVGLLAGLVARQLGWPPVRIAMAAAVAVASHGLLDALCEGGRGIPLLWPFSPHRFHSPWRFLPDAPRGVRLLSSPGLTALACEFLYFMPLTFYSLWPRRATLPNQAGLERAADGRRSPAAMLAPPIHRAPTVVATPQR
jgi:inner membrane protein